MVEKILKDLINSSPCEQTEIFFNREDLKLTRFANSEIHQNISQQKVEITITVYNKGRKGSAKVASLESGALKNALARAVKATNFTPYDENFKSLPSTQQKVNTSLQTSADETKFASADLRAEGVLEALKILEPKNVLGYGTFATQNNEFGIINSLGREVFWDSSRALFKILGMSKALGEGYAEDCSVNVTSLNPEKLAEKALNKALQSENPQLIDPGEYTVLLEPLAVGGMLSLLNMIGFNGLACGEGRSYFSQKEGQKVLQKPLTIIDDPFDENTIPLVYDFEGTAKKSLTIIEKGVFNSPLYDTYLAHKEGQKSTGHALPPDFRSMGALAMNLKLLSDNTHQDMFKDIDKGILITRFHYLGVIHPLRTIITGLTRDGTFLIEKGRITKPLKSLRFTQSIIEALNNVKKVGADPQRCSLQLGSLQTPSLHIDNFSITGISK